MEGINKKTPNVVVKDLNVIYNQGKPNEVRSLEMINLEIFPQEYVIIFGPSGCGKSTLLYTIAGLQKPTSGKVEVDGEDIYAYPKKKMTWYHRKKIGMIFQAFYLINSLKVIDNVGLPKAFDGVETVLRRKLSLALLERFKIAEQADKFPTELSGGQKQRVSIARSLINNPEIILADEPVGNLDSKSSQIVMSILSELNTVDKKTIVLVTHDPSHLQYGDRIFHMKDGKLVKIETVKKKQATVGSFIFKDGKVRDDLVREEHIPLDLKHLMKSFRGLMTNKIGSLLVPFKANQIFSHVFSSMPNEKIEAAIKKIEEYLFYKIDFNKLVDELDKPLEAGGAGWDRRLAEHFCRDVKEIVDESEKIDYSNLDETSIELADYFNKKFLLKFEGEQRMKFAKVIMDRLKNSIGKEEFSKLLDLPETKDGLGLNKRLVDRVSSELELLILIRYSK